MRFHIVGLPHTTTTWEFVGCAFTTNIIQFARMMTGLGHEVFVYSSEANDAPCTEHVHIVSREEREAWYGSDDPNTMPSRATWNQNDTSWVTMNVRAADAIRARSLPGDFVCLVNGWCQQRIAEALPELVACEFNAGYEHMTLDRVCVPSYTWLHYLYGKYGISDGRWEDAVIPHAFDPTQFEVGPDGGYLLYLGRLIRRKGIELASEVAQASGKRLVIAGQGATLVEPGLIVTPEFTLKGDHIDYHGPANVAERKALMAGASAVMMPTLYIEMFGCVAVEAMLSGAPVIATDWGGFPETVEHGVTGWRFRSKDEALQGLEWATALDLSERRLIRETAVSRYSLEVIQHQYQNWFDRLS